MLCILWMVNITSLMLPGTYVQVTLQQGGINDLQELSVAFNGRCAFHERRRRGGVRVIQMLYEAAPFLKGYTKKKKNQSICTAPFKIDSLRFCQTHTDLRKVIYESEMSPLQLCAGQRRQGVGIVQLSAVVWWKQVWIQANHMCRICKSTGGHICSGWSQRF